jgi:DNA-binding transcriptional MerR regulator
MTKAKRSEKRQRPTLEAFSIDHAEAVTKLTRSRLIRWDRLGFFSPEYLDDEDKGNPYSRIYSYEDLVGLRMLRSLILDYHVSISEIKAAYPAMTAQWTKPWSEIEIGVLKRKIVTDIKGQPRNITDGQLALRCIPLPSIADEVLKETEKLRKRKKADEGKFEHHKFVARNAAVFKGTRIPVSIIGDFIEAGYSDEAIIAEYPALTVKDVQSARRTHKLAA